MSASHESTSISAASLAGITVLANVPAGSREAIAARCTGHRYQANTQIVSHQDPGGDVYFIVSGSVRITFYSASGKEISFRDMHAGETFGELSALDGAGRSAYVLALNEAVVASLTRDIYLEILRQYPDIAMATLLHLAGLVRSLSERVVEFSTLGVKNRIHAELLRLALATNNDDNRAAIAPAPKHADIAARVSTHREAVTRELNSLSRRGLLDRKSNTMTVNDVEALARLVREVTDG